MHFRDVVANVLIALAVVVVVALFGVAFCSKANAQIAPITGTVADIVTEEAMAAGLDPVMMRRFAAIESSGNCNAGTGSYKGLFQLSEAEFRRRGGRGSVFDCRENARIGMLWIKDMAEDFEAEFGRIPTWTEIYLLHQQGAEGLRQHLADPERLAWRSMCATGEGRQKGDRWCRLAIWGNVPTDRRAEFGDVDHITSAQFVALWRDKVEGRPIPSPPVIRECRMPDGQLRRMKVTQ